MNSIFVNCNLIQERVDRRHTYQNNEKQSNKNRAMFAGKAPHRLIFINSETKILNLHESL